MKKFFVLILIFITSTLSAFARDINFLQVTDVHLNKENAHYLKDFVHEANQNYKNIDFVVFTGDNLDKANKSDLSLFLNIIKDLKFRTYVICGNHDLYKNQNMTGLYYMKTVKKNLGSYHSAKPNYIFKKGGVVFLAMNGVKEVIPGPNGYYRRSELIWLDKQLTKYKNKKVVILQHFPLLEAKSKSANLYKKEDYLEILNRHDNVIAVISGHYHNNREERIGNVYNVVTQKFSNNTYYKVITIDDENYFVYTKLVNNNEKD